MNTIPETVKFTGAPARWMKWSLLNLLVVAMVGMVTRYKISYSLPQLDFENLVHGHSHFAFAGWASSALFATIIAFFLDRQLQEARVYKTLFILNQVTSYGMLVSFLLWEYGPISIAIATGSMIVSYFYAGYLWKHTKGIRGKWSVITMRFALICMALSTLGPYALATMEIVEYFNLVHMNNAVYWFLHFQYNGWFTFAVLAIALKVVEERGGGVISRNLKTFMRLMMIACFPVYVISVLWTAPSMTVFIIAGAAGVVQLVATYFLLKEASSRKQELLAQYKRVGGFLLAISFFSLLIKIVLQFACVFPGLNKFVFGYRPVIIGYLHLVFLGFLTCFIIALAMRSRVIDFRKRYTAIGIVLFIAGFFLTEAGLLMHGVSVMIVVSLPILPHVLFAAAGLMVSGFALLAIQQREATRQ